MGAPLIGDCVNPSLVGTPEVDTIFGPLVVGKPVDDTGIGISVIGPPNVGSPVVLDPWMGGALPSVVGPRTGGDV